MRRLPTLVPNPLITLLTLEWFKIYTCNYSDAMHLWSNSHPTDLLFHRIAGKVSVNKAIQHDLILSFLTVAQLGISSLKRVGSPWKKINRRSYLTSTKEFAPCGNYFLELKTPECPSLKCTTLSVKNTLNWTLFGPTTSIILKTKAIWLIYMAIWLSFQVSSLSRFTSAAK